MRLRGPSQEARELELSGGVRSLPQVPWWNADRRAHRNPMRAALATARRIRLTFVGVPDPCLMRMIWSENRKCTFRDHAVSCA
jgi:hypothetical protein